MHFKGDETEIDPAVAEAIEWVRGRFVDVEGPSAADLIRQDRDTRDDRHSSIPPADA